jgi:hypothetical protein
MNREGSDMATAKRASKARKARKTSIRKVARRIQEELPATLDEFAKRVRVRLTRLEHAVERAEVRYRREIVRALRQASHQLGRFEAEGERRWKRLTTQARRDAPSYADSRRRSKAARPRGVP